MTKEEVLERLTATLLMLHQLQAEEFDYGQFVSRHKTEDCQEEAKADNADACGTICCVVGWYPKYIPESEFIWHMDLFGRLKLSKPDEPNILERSELVRFHGLPDDVISCLFYGFYIEGIYGENDRPDDLYGGSLKGVTHRFETVMQRIEEGKIPIRVEYHENL